MATSLILNVATFNVRGLNNLFKQHLLGTDCDRYYTDIISLQETKIVTDSSYETILPSGHNLIIMKQSKNTNSRKVEFLPRIQTKLQNH